jgi:hypothetical protein
VISKPSGFAFDVAVSSADYDARVLRELERQLTLRLPSIPPQRPVWTSTAAELLDAPRASVFGKSARLVVVLYQHLWGKDPTTKADAAAIKRRLTTSGPESVRVVLLDRTDVPAWLRKSPARSLGDASECADWIVAGVAGLGGATRRATDVVATIPLAGEDRATQQRDSFLASHRAITHLGREFDRLASEVAKRAATVNRDDTEVPLEVHRVPGRCTVQLGPVALTLSWVRTRPDTVATGRLMIIEWEGQMARGVAASVGPNPIPLRETVLRADATRVEDWQWKSDDVAGYAYDSSELAAHCVDSLAYALQDRGR